MTVPVLSEAIVRARQERAADLERTVSACRLLRERLAAVSAALNTLDGLDSPALRDGAEELSRLQTEASALEERTRLRRDRFSKGLITVSIAGLEKAGKTTFLQSLTGIQALPAFDERATAVCCEIHYAEDRSDFDLDFYTESEFLEQVLRPALETVAEALPEAERETLVPPKSANEFPPLLLPPLEKVPAGTTAYTVLRDLRILQDRFDECRQYLNGPPMTRRPLSELGDWVAHGRALAGDGEDRGKRLARAAAAKVCRVHAPFSGGSPHLRWIDTPGVDDPNRRARERTLKTVADETDLLVVASRPAATPSPGESFHRFWDSVSRQPDEIDLLNRMLFALNWDRRVDPEGENVKIHQQYLMDAGVPRHLFVGPFEAIQPEDAAALMDRVNDHLAAHLTEQDDAAVRAFASRLKALQARARLLHETLSRSRPSDEGLHDRETEAFHRWFHWFDEGGETGFWTEMVAAMDRAAREVAADERSRDAEARLNTIFAEEARAIPEAIPSPEALEERLVRGRGENPIPGAMRTVSVHLSRLVNRLAAEVREFGPLMQDRLVGVLETAGLGPLLAGEAPAERLEGVLGYLSDGGGTEDSPVLDVLREAMELPRNLKYVIRYELRPAVDFLDPTLWNAEEAAWHRLREMVTANGGDPESLAGFDSVRHPPATDSRERDHELLRRMAGNALLAIQTALASERNRPRRIADDFMRDCRVRMLFSPTSEQEWRTLLFRCRGTLLSGPIGRIRSASDRVRAFRTALNELEAALP